MGFIYFLKGNNLQRKSKLYVKNTLTVLFKLRLKKTITSLAY